MLSMKQEDAFHAFRKQISRENVAKDFKRFQHLAFIGADAARAWQQIAFLHQCVELEGNARWWHYLTLLGIECNHKAFHSDRRDLPYIRRLVPQLITRSNYDYYTALEFTRYYQIDDNYSALVYAEALLVETVDSEYQDKIIGVISEIHEQHLVRMILKNICKISGHDYDRLLFAFRLLLDFTTYREKEEVHRRVEILRLLKAFAALQNRSEQVLDKHVTRENKHDKLDLSFHELMSKPREVLSRLLTKENFTNLIGFAEPLRLERDELRMLLLRNMISPNLKCKAVVSGVGQVKLLEFSAFEDILLGLSDTESRVTAAEWLAENFPLDNEKLKALDFASKAAESGQNEPEDLTSTSFTGQEALTRLKTKILRVKVEMLLRNAKPQTSSVAMVINDEEQLQQLLALVSEPERLFRELYILYALDFYNRQSDMLNAVASGIGDLLHLPQAKIRLDLIRDWLVKDAIHFEKEVTSPENPFQLSKAEKLHQIDEDFTKRILYIISGSVKAGISLSEQIFDYLVEFAKDSQPRAGATFRAKTRAVSVILRLGKLYRATVVRFVNTKHSIEKTALFFRELVVYRNHCTHMVMFEEHRVPYDMAYFIKSDKEVLTRNFLRRFPRNESWVLRCASQLMLNFKVAAPDLWDDVLTNMLNLGMVRVLANILRPLSSLSFVRSLRCGRQVWEEVLTSPLCYLKNKLRNHSNTGQETSEGSNLSANEPRSDAGFLNFAEMPISSICRVLKRMVFLLERCPFLNEIDVPAFVNHGRDLAALAYSKQNGADIVRQLDLHGFAVKCAMVIPKPVPRFEALVEIIRCGGHGSVLRELLNTSCSLDGKPSEKVTDDNGSLIDDRCLIQKCFAEAEKLNDYACILHTPLEPRFVEYLAATANIDYLVSILYVASICCV